MTDFATPTVFVEVITPSPPIVVEVGIQGPPGPPGPPGDIGNISTDPGNALTAGTDQGLYVPDTSAGALLIANRLSELDTPEAKVAARQNLELQDIDGGTFN